MGVGTGSLATLAEDDKRALVGTAYRAVDDFFNARRLPDEWPAELDGADRKVFVAFRVRGKKGGSWSARRDNLAETVYMATLRTLEDSRYGGPLKRGEVRDLAVELFVLGDERPLDGGYEPGVHGLRLAKGDRQATFYNTVAVEGRYSTSELMARLCRKVGLEPNCHQDPTVQRYYFDTLHLLADPDSGRVVTLFRGNTPPGPPTVTEEDARTMLRRAEEWFLGNYTPDGLFTYKYDPSDGDYSRANNAIRQLMASRLLARYAARNPDLGLLHHKNLGTILNRWYREDGEAGYIGYRGRSKLGANALAVRALLASPEFERYRPFAAALVASLLAVQGEDGGFAAFYRGGHGADQERLLYFYSGQALLALAEWHARTGDGRALDAARRAAKHYITRYVDGGDYHPALVPWHTMALARLHETTGEARYWRAIAALNDRLVGMQDQEGRPYPDHLGRFYDPDRPEHGVPFSGSTAVYAEGLGHALEVARRVGDTARAERYRRAVLLALHNLRNLQFWGANTYYLQHPERVRGAIRYRVDDHRIRIDTTQHTIDALLQALAVIDRWGDPFASPGDNQPG